MASESSLSTAHSAPPERAPHPLTQAGDKRGRRPSSEDNRMAAHWERARHGHLMGGVIAMEARRQPELLHVPPPLVREVK